MKVKVRYLGVIKDIVGRGEEEVVLNGNSKIIDLLEQLAERYGERFKEEVWEPGLTNLKSGHILTVNGTLLGQLTEGVKSSLKDGDEVALMSVIYGG